MFASQVGISDIADWCWIEVCVWACLDSPCCTLWLHVLWWVRAFCVCSNPAQVAQECVRMAHQQRQVNRNRSMGATCRIGCVLQSVGAGRGAPLPPTLAGGWAHNHCAHPAVPPQTFGSKEGQARAKAIAQPEDLAAMFNTSPVAHVHKVKVGLRLGCSAPARPGSAQGFLP